MQELLPGLQKDVHCATPFSLYGSFLILGHSVLEIQEILEIQEKFLSISVLVSGEPNGNNYLKNMK
jgi:hypothetical protein